MVNKWMEHVKSVRAGNPGKSLKDILKMAKKTYKKSPVTKAAKKHHHKTKRHHKKHHKKHHKGKKRKRGQRGGEHNTDMAQEAGEAAPPSTQGGPILGRCDRACPMGLDVVDEVERGAECIRCRRCVETCPKEQALV